MREGVHFHSVDPSGIVIINMSLVMQGILQDRSGSLGRDQTTQVA